MCGIGGFCGNFSPEWLEYVSKGLAHRGPDAEGIWHDRKAGIGFAHRRLSIIDLTTSGAQPMASDNDEVVLVFNGEIYNFRELRFELINKGYKFHGRSDTEVLLHLYLAYGEKMLNKINGIFAFAIWDIRDQTLFLARDAMGVKPLYYAETDSGFAFASELKALSCLMSGRTELDCVALHRYMTFLWCPGAGTPLRHVHKLPPGRAMFVRDGKISKSWAWYQLPVFRGISPTLSESEACAGTVNGLRNAVKAQMVSDVPVGAFLSGGLDSSAIVAFAREQASNIECFTIEALGRKEPGMVDDLPFARRVAQHLDVPLNIVQIDANRMAADLESMVVQLDEPLADPASLNVLYISQLARERGIKVLLSGTGGDDLFSGYRRHLAIRFEKFWRWLPSSIRNYLERSSSRLDQRNPYFRRLAKLFHGAAQTGDSWIVSYFSWVQEAELLALYSPELRKNVCQASAFSEMLEFLKPLSSATLDSLEKMLALEQRFFLADHNLIYTDKMSMAAGVEVRVPFLDVNLVEHAARVPSGLKQHCGVGKWVLKKAMEPFLPKDVIYRPKSGFGAPLRRWMRHELKEILRDILSEESLRRRGLFDHSSVQSLIERNDRGEVDGAFTLLSLLCIEIWCRNFIDEPFSPIVGTRWRARVT